MATNANASHPLHTRWTLFCDSKKTFKAGKPWIESLVHIHTFGTVEEFWATICSQKKPSAIDIMAFPNPNFHFFRQGILPQWEDEANKKGGKWVMNLTAEEDLKNMDFVWEEILMSLVGESIDEHDLVTGAVFSKRKGLFRVAVWTRQTQAAAEGPLMQLATKMRGVLKLPESVAIEFFPHEATDSKTATLRA